MFGLYAEGGLTSRVSGHAARPMICLSRARVCTMDVKQSVVALSIFVMLPLDSAPRCLRLFFVPSIDGESALA